MQKNVHILTHQVFEHCLFMSQKMVYDGSPTKAQYVSLVASTSNVLLYFLFTAFIWSKIQFK